MVPNTGIKVSSPRDETYPQNMTETCFLSSNKSNVEHVFWVLLKNSGPILSMVKNVFLF